MYVCTRSFQLFYYVNKCRLLFLSLVESSGDVMKRDIADDLE